MSEGERNVRQFLIGYAYPGGFGQAVFTRTGRVDHETINEWGALVEESEDIADVCILAVSELDPTKAP